MPIQFQFMLAIFGIFSPFIGFWLLVGIKAVTLWVARKVSDRMRRNSLHRIRVQSKRYNLFRGMRWMPDIQDIELHEYPYRPDVPAHKYVDNETIKAEIARLASITESFELPRRWYRITGVFDYKQRFAVRQPTLLGLKTRPENQIYQKIYKEQGYFAASKWKESLWSYRILHWIERGRRYWSDSKDLGYRVRGYGDKAEEAVTAGQVWQKYIYMAQWKIRRATYHIWSGLYYATRWIQIMTEDVDRANIYIAELARRKETQLRQILEWRGFIDKAGKGKQHYFDNADSDSDFPNDGTWIKIPHGAGGYRGTDEDWEYEFIHRVTGEEMQSRFGDEDIEDGIWTVGTHYWLRLFTDASRWYLTPAWRFIDEYPQEGDWLQVVYEDERRYKFEEQQIACSLDWMDDDYVDEDKLEYPDHLCDRHHYSVLYHTSLQDIWANKIPTQLEVMQRLEAAENFTPDDHWLFEDEFDNTMTVWQYLVYIQLLNNDIYGGEYYPGRFQDHEWIIGLALTGILHEEALTDLVKRNEQKRMLWVQEQESAKQEGRDANWGMRPNSPAIYTDIWEDINNAQQNMRTGKYVHNIWDDLNDGICPFLPVEEQRKLVAQRKMKPMPGFGIGD